MKEGKPETECDIRPLPPAFLVKSCPRKSINTGKMIHAVNNLSRFSKRFGVQSVDDRSDKVEILRGFYTRSATTKVSGLKAARNDASLFSHAMRRDGEHQPSSIIRNRSRLRCVL